VGLLFSGPLFSEELADLQELENVYFTTEEAPAGVLAA
jgi:hypothetical protein